MHKGQQEGPRLPLCPDPVTSGIIDGHTGFLANLVNPPAVDPVDGGRSVSLGVAGRIGPVYDSGPGRCGLTAFSSFNIPFLRQSGTIMSGFASTIDSISQVRFGGKKGGTER